MLLGVVELLSVELPSVELLSVELLLGGMYSSFAQFITVWRERASLLETQVLTLTLVVAQHPHLKPNASVPLGQVWTFASTFFIWLQD